MARHSPHPRLASLREATSSLHRRLDRAIDASGAFVRAEAYLRYLVALTRFHGAVDRALALGGIDTLWPRWQQWRPLPALQHDLQALGRAPTDVEAEELPALPDEAAVLGTLYVVVGASMGARLLYPRARALGFDAARGAAYLASQAEDQAAWPEFVTLLSTRTLPRAREPVLPEAAITAFALAQHCVADEFEDRGR
jgi:heme oxygenase